MAVAALCLVFATALALRRNRLVLALVLGLTTISVDGLLMVLASSDAFPDTDLRRHLARQSFRISEPVSFEGCVVRESEPRGEDSVAIIELTAFLQKDRWTACQGKGILRVPEPGTQTHQGERLLRGDKVKGWATWKIPRNFENPGSTDSARMLARRGIFVIGRVKSLRLLETVPGGCTNPWTRLANLAGDRVRQSLEPLRKNGRVRSAAILASLIIGDYSGLDTTTRETFQNSGTYHVLVISGLHVAWIAGLLIQCLKLIRVPERARYLSALAAILLYTCVVGFQASITRCLWMFLLYLAGRMLFRRADSVNVLLVSALILLVGEPNWLFEAGFQLSFLSVAAIALTAAPAVQEYLKPLCAPLRFAGKPDRLFLQPGAWHRRGRFLRTRYEIFVEEASDSWSPWASGILLVACRALAATGFSLGSLILTSAAVQIWIEPLLACYFNRMSWISPAANLVIVPCSSIVLGAGVFATLVAGVPVLGPESIHLAGSLASFLLSCASNSASISGAWQRCPTPSAAWVLAGILLLFLWSFFEWHRLWIPIAGIAVLLACLSRGSVPGLGILFEQVRAATCSQEKWDRNTAVLSMTFLDVGEGDSIVIRFPDKRFWVLDGGGLRQAPSEEEGAYRFDIGEAVVSRYLWHFWVGRIDRLLLSHPDADHAGGVPAIMRNFSIGRFDFSQGGSDRMISECTSIAREKRIRTHQLFDGAEERIGSVAVRVLNPPAKPVLNSTNENSMVLEISFKRFSALLTGDLEKSGEMELLSHQKISRCSLLKVAHHGSRSGTTDPFLSRIQPRWGIISAGRNNPYGHPSQEILKRLRQHGAQPILTVDEGAVTFETDGKRFILKSHVRGVLARGVL
jgi:competence protein ComEC